MVDGELSTTPTSSYDEVAKRLGFSGLLTDRPGHLTNDAHRRFVKAVGSWLGRQQDKFLVILDITDDPEAINLASFTPHHNNGDVIITSRDTGTMVLGQLFPVGELSEFEAVSLLSQASPLRLDINELLNAAKEITVIDWYLGPSH